MQLANTDPINPLSTFRFLMDNLHYVVISDYNNRSKAEGRKADNVKPLKGFDSGILEIVLRHRGDAFRVVYAVQIDEDLWVIHAFQKKSKEGIKTPKYEIDLVHERLKRLKEVLR